MNRLNLATLFGVAAVAAVFLSFPSKPASTGPAHPAKSEEEKHSTLLAAATSAGSEDGPLKPVWDFFGTPLPTELVVPGEKKEVSQGDKGKSVDCNRREWPPDLKGWKFRFLIATVPDPVDSGFPYLFDQMVEALQRALEVDNYIIDRAWLPWQPGSVKKKQSEKRPQERLPGLILFRHSPPRSDGKDHTCEKRLLALLLVGETVTAGIHKAAFANAVNIICCCPADNKEGGNQLRVVGPFFSGSAQSLGMTLRQARSQLERHHEKRPEPWIKVVCGNASGFDHEEFVNSGWKGNGDPQKTKVFQTTILPDDLILRHVCHYLGNPASPDGGEAPLPILVLQEANTIFGLHTGRGIRKEADKIKANKNEPDDGDKKGQPNFVHIPFPIHISQLRASYTREQLARYEAQGLPHSGRNLPFPTVEEDQQPGKGREAIKPHAPLVTASINELVLNNLVTTMDQRQTKYISLVSTDSQDKIFLGRLVRDRYPDVQLVTVGADLLFTHEDYNADLRGMIVGSTYPLHPAYQRWSDRSGDKVFPSRVLFAHHGFQGCYNATLVHLAEAEAEELLRNNLNAYATILLQNQPFTAVAYSSYFLTTPDPKSQNRIVGRMMDYGWEKKESEPISKKRNATVPPLWISIVSNNGQLIPVTIRTPSQYDMGGPETKYLYTRELQSETPEPQTKLPDFGRVAFTNMWFLLFIFLLVGNLYLFQTGWKYLRESDWDSRTKEERCSLWKQRADFTMMCLAQILLYGRAAELALTPLLANSQADLPSFLATWFVEAASLFMIGFTVFRLVQAHTPWPRTEDVINYPAPIFGLPSSAAWLSASGFWIVVANLFLLVLVATTLVCFIWQILDAAVSFGPLNVIHFQRVVFFTNGVSPLLPRLLFCSAVFTLGFFLVKKLYVAKFHYVPSPFSDLGSRFQRLSDLHQEVRSELMPPSTLRKHFVACEIVIILGTALFIKVMYDSIPPVDGLLFGKLALLGLLGCSLLIGFTLLQIYFAWASLRKLLRCLARLPMQSAFERLAAKVVADFGGYLFALRPRDSHLSLMVKQFQVLSRLFPAFRGALRKTVANNRNELKEDAQLIAAKAALAEQFPTDPPNSELIDDPGTKEWSQETEKKSNRLAKHLLGVLACFWPSHSMGEAFGRPLESEQPDASPPGKKMPQTNPIQEWVHAAEDFVALEILRYLSQFMAQLRNLLYSVTIGSLLLLLAATVYPFFPQSQILLILILLSATAAVAIITFLVQLNRDELVSRITRTTPHRFTPDLAFLHGATVFVLPIVAGLMVQFPFVTSTIRSLLNPLTHIIR